MISHVDYGLIPQALMQIVSMSQSISDIPPIDDNETLIALLLNSQGMTERNGPWMKDQTSADRNPKRVSIDKYSEHRRTALQIFI